LFPVQRGLDISNRPRIPIPDEDPYSVAGNGSGSGSGGSSGASGPTTNGGPTNGFVAAAREQLLQQSRRSDKPPKLPPRDNLGYPQDIPKVRLVGTSPQARAQEPSIFYELGNG